MNGIVVINGCEKNDQYPNICETVELLFKYEIVDSQNNLEKFISNIILHFGPEACCEIDPTTYCEIEEEQRGGRKITEDSLDLWIVYPNRRWTWLGHKEKGNVFYFQSEDDMIFAKLLL